MGTHWRLGDGFFLTTTILALWHYSSAPWGLLVILLIIGWTINIWQRHHSPEHQLSKLVDSFLTPDKKGAK
jgi:hypothetical protein